jgi:hypothetical protein
MIQALLYANVGLAVSVLGTGMFMLISMIIEMFNAENQ